MHIRLAVTTLAVASPVIHGSVIEKSYKSDLRDSNTVLYPRDDSACLNIDARQTASSLTGQEAGTDGMRAGQSPSKIDHANFINFCSGHTLTNGRQLSSSSCNGIPMGRIPAKSDMVSSIITYPQPGDQIMANTTFNVTIQTRNLRAGFLVNPSVSYYTAPQDLDEAGHVIGHCHVTIQDIGSFKTTTPPDAGRFAFFKGVDDAGDGKGLLSTSVVGGLPVGVYRLCTMIAARNHQPITMPIAQRGAQDDCTKFEVVASKAKVSARRYR